MNQPTKSFNTRGGKNRLRFASAKFRSKRASADVYRRSDNRHSVSSTGVREKRVHDTSFRSDGGSKKRKSDKGKHDSRKDGEDLVNVRYFGRDTDMEGLGTGRTAVIVSSTSNSQLEKSPLATDENITTVEDRLGDEAIAENDDSDDDEQTKALITGGTIFLTELEVSAQRNGSQLYQKLVRGLRPLCKSLAELLHHRERLVDMLCAYLLSPCGGGNDEDLSDKAPYGYEVNVATNDVLHLFGVLARELRQEIYPYLTTKIMPRIIDDMLNPPTITITSTMNSSEKHRQSNISMDVSHIESAFRTLSYLFKYNSDRLTHNHSPMISGEKSSQNQQTGDADILRRFYGKTICHKREVVRRLACEAYAPLLRKCTEKGLKRHLSRTVKALAGSLANGYETGEELSATHQQLTHGSKRARDDAIDGVSSLFFEVSRGAPGRVHSKIGRLVVKTLMDCLISFGRSKSADAGAKEQHDHRLLSLRKNKARDVYEVASQFLFKLRGHVVRRVQEGENDSAGVAFADVLDELHRALEMATSMLSKDPKPSSAETQAVSDCVAGHVIDLMTETINFQDGRLIGNGHDRSSEVDRIIDSLQKLIRHGVSTNSEHKLQEHILQYLCSAWKTNPTHPSFALRLGMYFPSIVGTADSDEISLMTGLDSALFLGQNLLPYLPKKVASTYLIPALLGAAAFFSRIEKCEYSPLELLHKISTSVWSKEDVEHGSEIDVDDHTVGAFFTLAAAEHCPGIPSKVRSSLFDICLTTTELENVLGKEMMSSKATEQVARVGYISRCIPFLVSLECAGCNDENDEDDGTRDVNHHAGEVLEKVFHWYSLVLKMLDTKLLAENADGSKATLITQSMVLESFSKSAMECHKRVSSSRIVSTLKRVSALVRTVANSLLFQHPHSIWSNRGVAAFTEALSIIYPGSYINDQSNEVFELLVPNLAESNHFLRLYTLQILDSYPVRPFIADHADLDLTNDLEEEPTYRLQSLTDGIEVNENALISGSCDVISLLRVLESIPVALPTERKLTSQLTRIEVYARTGKLPIVYAEAVACHMLGLLHVKFAPIWPHAVKVIVSLSLAQEGPTWPYVEMALKQSITRPSAAESAIDQTTPEKDMNPITHHHSLCLAWETSKGRQIDVFGPRNQPNNSQVSRHAVCDELTLFESVWSVLENGPHLTSTKSKAVVPIFFEFLASQYYVFHQDDPDSREIDLSDYSQCTRWPKEELTRKSMQTKLGSFLKVFAAVKGPQQLFKHKVLLQLFVSLLANPDGKLSNLAFSCVFRFKLPYLSPYVEYVQPMLKREGLREALTKFDLSPGGEIVDADHRLSLMPIVIRILFGRLLSRGNGAKKSSKDTPIARRAAILAFFSGIGNDGGELNYFIYLMVRNFIPNRLNMENEGVQIDKETLKRLVAASNNITSAELMNIPLKRQEGFLNLLSDVISQIGFGVKFFVDTFMNILLAISEQTEHALIASIKNQEMDRDNIEHESISVDDDGKSGFGRIRSLTFLRLADIMGKFASSIDFSQYGERLWKSMASSVTALPNTIINAENPPSLLRLIETTSMHPRLISLLHQSDSAVIAVFKCIAETTRMKVMHCVLRIIGGLLTDGGTLDDSNISSNSNLVGHPLVLSNIHLLIAQFTERLGSGSAARTNLDEEDGSRHKLQNPTDGLQLSILCRVSELLVSAGDANTHNIETMESLCNLLVPLLKFDSRPNQFYMIRTVNCLIPKLSNIEALIPHFHTISKLLGPRKNSVGIKSYEHRNALSLGISAICNQSVGCPNWKIVAHAVADLNAASTSYVDEHNFDRMLPVLNGLGSSSLAEKMSWRALSMINSGEISHLSNDPKPLDDTRVLQPLIYTCFHMLYDSDGVVSRASNNALKCLVATSSEIVSSNPGRENGMNQNPWVKLVETVVVPCLKVGITTKEIATRRIFVLLLSHVARHFIGCKSVHLYGDLRCLIRDDDQDLDFFLNVTHVQLHRRARAFTRLRRIIFDHKDPSAQAPLFSEQSLGNVLLPLAMHPVYEYKSKDDEVYALEAIATVGEICTLLPWSKYNTTLQSVLNNLPRYPDQERFLIAMLCAIIDAFHFSVDTGTEGSDDGFQSVQAMPGNAVWRTLKNRIIPKVESFMVKEKVDKHGSKNKSIRSSVVLALMKLFQKLPIHIFESDLPKLVTVVCNALKNKDSNERDIARETLSKMVVGLDMKYLPLILSELSVSLSEGYKLHVRSATLHSLLVAITKASQPNESNDDKSSLSFFDRCVPAMLDLIHQDIFGKASEIREVENVGRRLIKEAMGSKSQDSLEIISRCIVFKPSQVVPGFTHASVVHALVTPFLDRLRDPDVSSSTMRKVKECLHRIAVGFSSNPTAKYDEVLPFVYATVAPFVHGEINTTNIDADLDVSDDEVEAPVQVSKTNGAIRIGSDSKQGNNEDAIAVPVAKWTPSTLGSAASQKSAYRMKINQKKALHKVSDGAAAPKLTGSSRHMQLKLAKVKTLNNPANACAVSFGLTLLNSSLKRSKLDVSDENICAMSNPYLLLLTHCVSFSSDAQAIVLSLRCLEVFLRMDLPSVPKAASDLGTSILDHLTTSNAASNTQSDIVQGCFKTLTLLISHPKFASHSRDSTIDPNSTEALPLTSDQMHALLSLLHSAVREHDHHNATFGLVKAIASKRYVSSEFYDLMDIILKLSVQSQKSAIRLQSSQIFVQYLLEYPMGSQRMDNHINQIILNIKYEFEEGRLAAIELLSSVIQKFPLAVLDERCQFFFLPLVLQLVNDDSKKCKEAISDCMCSLLQRLSTESVQALFGYSKRWSQSSGANSPQMQLASAQLFGIFVDSRPDYVKRGRNGSDIISTVQEVVAKQNLDDKSGWELLYHILICTEKLNKHMPSLMSENYELWAALVNLMVYPHPWVLLVSSRIISSHLSSVDPSKLVLDGAQSFVTKVPGCLYKIASNSCRQLDVEDVHFVEATCTLAIKAITWAFRAMKQYPNICYDENVVSNDEKSKDPCLWVITRLSNIAKPKGNNRRSSVFKCFAALCTSCNPEHLRPYLELMIEPIDRAIREASNKFGPDDQPDTDPLLALPKDVLEILEDTCGTEAFVKAYAEVNRKAREKRDKRKQDIASEAVHNPSAAAQRKINKQLREKERRKRKIDDNRSKRGASKKRLAT